MANSWHRFLLIAVLPSLTLVVGVFVARSAPSSRLETGNTLPLMLGCALGAPILAAVVLRFALSAYDVVLVGSAGMLVAVGVSTTYGLSLSPGGAGEFYSAIASRHAVFAALGFAALPCGAIAERGLDWTRRYPITILVLAILLTVTTVIFGETVNGARLWLEVGPARFQPSEIARLLIALAVAIFLYERRHLLSAPWRVRSIDLPPAPYLLPLAGALAIAVGMLVLQNDLGMAALVVFGAAAAAVSVVASRASLGVTILMLGAALAGAYRAVPRVRDRISGWLDPWLDPVGRGYQFVQGEYSLAAGGVAGSDATLAGLNVPEVHTDMILIAIAGRFGAAAALATLALGTVLVSRCMLAGLRSREGFRALVAVSLAGLLAIQIVLIVGGSLRVLPLTGLTFPLVSYGGTSMIATQFALGIIVGIGARPRETRTARSEQPAH